MLYLAHLVLGYVACWMIVVWCRWCDEAKAAGAIRK